MTDAAPTTETPTPEPGGQRKLTRSESARLAALARWGKYKGKGRQPKGGKGRKPAKTPEQREAERRQEAQTNRATVMASFGSFGRDTLPDMEALASGEELDADRADGMVMSGLAERLSTGSVVLTAEGRRLYNAASRGDVGTAKEAIDRAEANAGDRMKRDKAKADKEKQPKGGGGKGGKDKPTADDKAKAKAEERAKTASDTAGKVGLKPADVDALRQARDAGGADNAGLREIGLIDDNGDTTDQGRRALSALERGDAGGYRAAVQDAKARMGREQAAREREQARFAREDTQRQERAKRDSDRAAAQASRQKRMDRAQALRVLGETQKAVQTYTPPEAARNNARKVLRWREEHGDDVRGMTAVGWARARQLASGRPLSYRTVARMSAFNRHRQNADVAPEHRDAPWRDAGYVAWLGWGGTSGIEWARGITGAAKAAMVEAQGSLGGYTVGPLGRRRRQKRGTDTGTR